MRRVGLTSALVAPLIGPRPCASRAKIATGLDAAVIVWADGALADRQGLKGPRLQDIDRPAHIERLPQPARARRPRVQVKPGRLVPRPERPDGIVGDHWRKWDVGQRPSVRSPEP